MIYIAIINRSFTSQNNIYIYLFIIFIYLLYSIYYIHIRYLYANAIYTYTIRKLRTWAVRKVLYC